MSKEVRTALILEANRVETWDALTTQEGVTSFFCEEADITLMVGATYGLNLSGKLVDGGEVLTMDYLQLLTLTWKHPKKFGGGTSKVSFAIEPVDPEHTRVIVIHTFEDADGERLGEGMVAAWDEVLWRMRMYLATLKPHTDGADGFWGHM